jgi:hypothetical protein
MFVLLTSYLTIVIDFSSGINYICFKWRSKEGRALRRFKGGDKAWQETRRTETGAGRER